MAQTDASTHNWVTLDALDRDIISILKVDGRITFTEISKQLNIPEATARYRVQRLLQSGVIQIHAWLNPEKLGTSHVVIIRITADHHQVTTVAETLSKMAEVQFVAITTGQQNIVIDVFFGTHDELLVFFERLFHIPGIISYEAQVVLKLLKAEYQYTFI